MCGTLFLFAQANFDPIGRDGCSLDNVPDEAFHLDGRRGEQSLPRFPESQWKSIRTSYAQASGRLSLSAGTHIQHASPTQL
jgi:hypothetical protein